MRIHTRDKLPYSCEICNKQFNSLSNMYSHRVFHSYERKYKCESCDKRFKRYSCLKNHMLTHQAVYLMCTDCNKPFKGEHNLKRHVRENMCRKKANDDIYQCGICHKTLRDRSNLVRHVKSHNSVNNKLSDLGDKVLYSCAVCSRSFTKKSNCEHHMKYVHSSTKPYQCGVCGHELKSLCGLKLHMSNHI